MTPSPESRLLDLIRKKSGPVRKERWRSWGSAPSRWVNARLKLESVDPWRWANGCLALLLVGTLGYGGFVLFRSENPRPRDLSDTRRGPSERDAARRKPSFFDLTRRDLFKDMAPPPPPPVVEIPAGPPPPPKVPLSERASRFRLVGILSGDKPQAIIEDTQTQRTLYASPGQRIEGMMVESVTAGKVVLSDGDERFDLTL